jgi:cytoskeletal protein RodZ
MSDSSQGPGWWQASDGKWYPPSAMPGGPYVPPTSPMPTAKQSQPTPHVAHGPWRRFRSLPMVLQVVSWVVAGFVLLGAIGAATGAANKPPQTHLASAPTTVTTAAKAAPSTALTRSDATTTSTTSTTVAPTTVAPTTVAPTTTRPPTTQSTPLPTAAPTVSCHPLTNGGKCYEPGEFCRNSDHGVQGVAGNGEAIVCTNNSGWRWEPTPP